MWVPAAWDRSQGTLRLTEMTLRRVVWVSVWGGGGDGEWWTYLVPVTLGKVGSRVTALDASAVDEYVEFGCEF